MEASGKASVASLVHFLNKGKKYNLKGRGKVRSLERLKIFESPMRFLIPFPSI